MGEGKRAGGQTYRSSSLGVAVLESSNGHTCHFKPWDHMNGCRELCLIGRLKWRMHDNLPLNRIEDNRTSILVRGRLSKVRAQVRKGGGAGNISSDSIMGVQKA